MTKRSTITLKPWLAALSLGVTVGGWALLGRQMLAQKPDTQVPSAPVQPTASQSVAVTLPPVPTVEALRAYAATGTGDGQSLTVPQVPVVTAPAPRPKNDKVTVFSAPRTAPLARTGASR